MIKIIYMTWNEVENVVSNNWVVKAEVLCSDLFLYHSMYLKEQGSEEYLLHSCMKFALSVCFMFLSDHNYTICIRSLQLTSPTFAVDVTLLALHPSFLVF